MTETFAAGAGRVSSAGTPALAVDHLSKRFGDRVAFADVSFEVGYGEVFGFLGPNGAGKPVTELRHSSARSGVARMCPD